MPKAVFLECDGVMVETAAADLAAFNTALEAAGLNTQWDDALFNRIAATPGTPARFTAYFERFGWPLTQHGNDRLLETLCAAHKGAFLAAVRQGGLSLRPGIKALIDGVHDSGAVLAIVTDMDGDVVTQCLSQLGLAAATKLKFMVCGGAAERAKPAAEPYRSALQMAALTPDQVVAVEGSPAGIRSAKAAGLMVVAAGNDLFPQARLSAADKVIPDLSSEAGMDALTSAILG